MDNKRNFYTPEKCEQGYTIFAETDEVLASRGITNIDQLKAYADSVYGACAAPGSGWYDYARNNNINISTGNDFKNPWNTLSMFVRYHVLNYKIPFEKLVNSHNQVSKVTLVEYYETMLPYTLVKVTRNNGRLMLNRWTANSSLTDLVAELGTPAMHSVLFEGIELVGIREQVAAVNGYIHPLKSMLAYEERVPRGALNERIRIDDTAICYEMMSNLFRGIAYSTVKALNGGKQGTDGRHANCDYIRFPPRFFKNIAIYNGEDTRLYYFPDRAADGATTRRTSSTVWVTTTSPCVCRRCPTAPTSCDSATPPRTSAECCSSTSATALTWPTCRPSTSRSTCASSPSTTAT